METDQLITERTRRYIEHVASGMDSVAAALAAGYSKSYARVVGYRLGQNPAVAAAIAAIRAEGRIKSAYTLTRAMEEAERAAAFAVLHKNPMALVKATELRAKLSGLLIDRVAVEHVDVRGALADARARVLNITPRPSVALDPFEPSLPAPQGSSPNWEPFKN